MKFVVRMLAVVAPLLAGLSFAGSALAGDDLAYDRFFLMPNISTLGGGVEAGYRVNESWQVRAGVNGGALNFVYKDKDSDLHSRATLLNGGVTADYFAFGNDFYVSGGLKFSANKVEGKVKNMHGKLKNGAQVFVPDPLTSYTVKQNVIQPYLGAGYSVKVKENVSLNFDLGALYAGTPDVDVDSQAQKLGFSRRSIRREIERARDRLAPFKVYPVVQVGLKFDF